MDSAGLDAELRHVRELLSRIVLVSRTLLAELEALEKIRDDTERGAALRKLLERRIPELRIVTERNSGDYSAGRIGPGTQAKP